MINPTLLISGSGNDAQAMPLSSLHILRSQVSNQNDRGNICFVLHRRHRGPADCPRLNRRVEIEDDPEIRRRSLARTPCYHQLAGARRRRPG